MADRKTVENNIKKLYNDAVIQDVQGSDTEFFRIPSQNDG